MESKIYKKLIVHNIGEFPKDYDYKYGDIAELEDYDLDRIVLLDIDECWYWYAQAPYEGSGKILMRKGDLYDFEDLGHCSCFGPMERIKFNGKKIDDIKMSQEYEKSIMGLKKFAEII